MFGLRKQQSTKLYHGISAMAMKGLVDMGDGSFSGGSSQAFSQLPTQSVPSASPTHIAMRSFNKLGCTLSWKSGHQSSTWQAATSEPYTSAFQWRRASRELGRGLLPCLVVHVHDGN